MSWIAALDSKSRTWSRPAYVAYHAAKWYLVLTGAIAVVGVVADRLGIWSLY